MILTTDTMSQEEHEYNVSSEESDKPIHNRTRSSSNVQPEVSTNSTPTDKDELVTGNETQIRHAISTNPSLGDQLVSINSQELLEFVCQPSSPIKINLMLLIVTGLPQCGKSKHLINALQRAMPSKNEQQQQQATAINLKSNQQGNIQYTELAAIVSSLDQEPIYFETSTETTYSCAIESALKLEYMRKSKHICGYDFQENLSIFEKDPKLDDHFRKIMEDLKEGTSRTQFTHTWQQHLVTELTLINIWDMGVNKAAFHFLPALWGKLEESFMWLFFDVDRDLYNLDKCPELLPSVDCSESDSKHVMPYRTRHRYLFREAMLAQTKKHKPNCSIFGIRKSQEKDVDTISDHIIDGTIPMGVDNIIEKKLELLDEDDDTLKKKLDEIVHRTAQYRQKDIPLNFIFLRSLYYNLTNIMFVKKEDLEKKAQLLEIKDASQMKEFYELFSSGGSIIDLDHPDIDFVIMRPMGFITKLNNLFADKIDSDHQLKEYGLLTIETAKVIFGETEYSFFLEVLTAVNLALKINKGETIYDDDLDNAIPTIYDEVYYIPDVRDVRPDLKSHEHSLLLCMSMNSSLCHMQVLFAKKYLARNKNCKLYLKKSSPVNVTKFQTSNSELLCLQYLGEVIEFRYTIGHPTKNAARTIIDACCEIMNSDNQRLHKTSYNFAINCSKDGEFKGADRIAQPHHIVVPYDEHSLEKCKCDAKNNDWNNVLKEIADDTKLLIPTDRLLQFKRISYQDLFDIATTLHSTSDVTNIKFINRLKNDVRVSEAEKLSDERDKLSDEEIDKLFDVSMYDTDRRTLMSLILWEKYFTDSKLESKCSSTALATLLVMMTKDEEKEIEEKDKKALHTLARKLDVLVYVTNHDVLRNESNRLSNRDQAK